MKETLYTIPVNDAFSVDCECPICTIYQKLQQDAVEFTMGPSYMEDDVRMETDRIGFCDRHMELLWKNGNRLGLALMVKTHMDRSIAQLETLTKNSGSLPKGGLFKKAAPNPVTDYLKELECSCYICNKINYTFDRYILTIFHLWKNDAAFQKLYQDSKGFCLRHYRILLESAPKYLNGSSLNEFAALTHKLFLENMKRVDGDVEWFTDKFDYRYKDAPWKNAKDALSRALIKLNSLTVDTDK